jgi:metal-responsive CopG/Arc/MetJ family transcriptional regulator
MLTLMPRPKKPAVKEEATVDVFSRMDADVVDKLDALAKDQKRSRSGMVAWLVQQYVQEHFPKLDPRK